MKISIAERFHPFSHRLGTKFLLPKSSLTIRAYPTRLQFNDLENRIPAFFVDFDFIGPVKDFTAELDLEMGMLKVFGRTQNGYMRYLVQREREGVCLTMEKIPSGTVACRHSFSPHSFILSKAEELFMPLALEESEMTIEGERLSLGMHKSQEWDSLCCRLDFKEIFPLWHRLCAWIPSKSTLSKEGNYSLLEECRKKIENREKEEVLTAFESFFLAAFEGVLTPRVLDTEYQGILSSSISENTVAPLPLLVQGGQLIRSLFFQEDRGKIAILPCLPAQFHCGRMMGIKTSQGNVIDFEWTKKSLRRLRVTSSISGEISLKLPKGIASCRVRIGRKTIKCPSIDSAGILRLALHANTVAHLDRFFR